MCIHSHPCDVWCMKVFMYMCAHVGEQVHACTHLHASNVECFPRVPGSELRTSGTLLRDHLQAPQTPVPARPSNGNNFGLCLASRRHQSQQRQLLLTCGQECTGCGGRRYALDYMLLWTGSILLFPADSSKLHTFPAFDYQQAEKNQIIIDD